MEYTLIAEIANCALSSTLANMADQNVEVEPKMDSETLENESPDDESDVEMTSESADEEFSSKQLRFLF